MTDLAPLDAGYDYNAPLRWQHEDGREGTEVAFIPPLGRVFFFDPRGPVLRLDNVREGRWLVKQIHFYRLGQVLPVRITRLKTDGDGYYWILPNPTQPLVFHCTGLGAHDGCDWRAGCQVMEAAVETWIEAPIVAASKKGTLE